MNQFVYGDKSRIFVNTSLGCKASCKYCYLDSLNIKNEKSRISADEAIKLVVMSPFYKEGLEGTIVSIGCYSECMDNDDIYETVKIIKYFCKKNNYIQLATKKMISKDVMEELNEALQYEHQLIIFVSMPTFSNSKNIEINVDSPIDRLKNIELCKNNSIDVVLYIKPFLKNITNLDIEKYIEIINKYDINVVLGAYLNIEKNDKEVLVGENRLYEHGDKDMEKMAIELSHVRNVYFHSTDYILDLRKRKVLGENKKNE